MRLPIPGGEYGGVCSTASYLFTHFVRERGVGRVFASDTFVSRVAADPPAKANEAAPDPGWLRRLCS